MITRIEAYRYRCFQRLVLDVKPFQVLVGKNGAGKSTLLDIPVLLGEMFTLRSARDAFFKPILPQRRRARADAPSELIFNQQGEWFALAIEAALPQSVKDDLDRNAAEKLSVARRTALDQNPSLRGGRVRYEISFRADPEGLLINHEYLFILPENREIGSSQTEGLWGETAVPPSDWVRTVVSRTGEGAVTVHPEVPARGRPLQFRVPSTAPALSSIPLDVDGYKACNWFRDFLTTGNLPLALNLAAMRESQTPPGQDYVIARDGTTLPWSVLHLAETQARYDEWIAHIQSAIPYIRCVKGKTTEDAGLAYIEATYGDDNKVKSSGLSDGTLTILALTILPYLDNVPALVTVEEPENGIHPKAIEAILESLSVMPHSQVIATTHSPIVVAVTSPERLLCLRQTRAEGVQATWGNEHPRLREWQGTPTLDTLHNAGVL
jgi:hypothetical protein